MTSELMRELSDGELGEIVGTPDAATVLITAPNFEDRSVYSAEWVIDTRGADDGLGIHLVTLQTPGVDDVFDRIKADNATYVAGLFRGIPRQNLTRTQIDMPAIDTRRAIERTKDLAAKIGPGTTLLLDISSLPRTIVRFLLEGLLQEWTASQQFSRLICLYTAAADYPAGADNDLLGGIEGYFTGRHLPDLVEGSTMLDAVISLAGTQHDAAQTLDALWARTSPAHTAVSGIVFLNRENLVYSYLRLARGTWAINRAAARGAKLEFAFEMSDVVRRIFDFADAAATKHIEYARRGGEEAPTLLLGGFGPKPVGLAALLARTRYVARMNAHNLPSTSDVLQITGWQYTTRYSHGTGPMKAFEIDVAGLYEFAAGAPLTTAE